jgi:magnesium transporter
MMTSTTRAVTCTVDPVAGAVSATPADVQSISHYVVTEVPTADAVEMAGTVRDRIAVCEFRDASNVFVLRNGRLAGVVEVGRLLGAGPLQSVSELMTPGGCPAVVFNTDREEAASLAIRSGGAVLAVCDGQGRFVGAVPAQSLISILRDEHIEDLHHMAGILSKSEAAKKALAASPWRQAGFRLPWLLFGIIGSAMATAMMARFETALAANVAVAFFVPGIVYLADAIGTQSEVVAVRALSLTDGKLVSLLVREFGTSLLVGTALGAITFPLVCIVFANVALAATVAAGVLIAGVAATIVGILLPWTFARIGYDPALASGPIATVLQDTLSLATYFAVASILIF